jgi:hypothetical protein
MTAIEIDVFKAAGDEAIADLFARFFAEASLGWIVPVHAEGEEKAADLVGETADPEIEYTVYAGETHTGALLARLEREKALPPIWCALSIRVPKEKRLARRLVLRRIGAGGERTPLATLEVLPDRLRIRFSAGGEPIAPRSIPDSALERERWQLASQSAKEELESVLDRARRGGSKIESRGAHF